MLKVVLVDVFPYESGSQDYSIGAMSRRDKGFYIGRSRVRIEDPWAYHIFAVAHRQTVLVVVGDDGGSAGGD